MQAENLEFRWNSVVTELLHEEKLTGVKVKNVHTGEEDTIPCDGVFISVGRKPATELVQGQLELDRSGYIIADETTATNLPGVYAVGDVRTKPLRQVVTAVADGATAVHMAEEFLAGGVYHEGTHEELAAAGLVYPGRRTGRLCLLHLGGLRRRILCHHLQSVLFGHLHGPDRLASLRRVRIRQLSEKQQTINRILKQNSRKQIACGCLSAAVLWNNH